MLTIRTTLFQDMLSKALRGASSNPIYPITGMMEIKADNGHLKLTTTDGTQFLSVKHDIDCKEPFQTIIPIDIISKLIMKTTSEHTTLELTENSLHVEGNGQYDIALLDMDTDEISGYPIPQIDGELLFETSIKVADIKTIIASNSEALATALNYPQLLGYFMNNELVLTSDSIVIAKNEIGIMPKPVLMPPSLMELITIIEDEEIKVKMYDNYQTEIHTSEIDIIGSTMEEVVDFPLAEITSVDVPFESSCKVSRTNLLNVLDRLSLFIETYDENGIYLNFTKNKLIITSKKDNASESVAYIKSNIEVDAFVCLINIITLKKQLEAYTSDIITLEFGREEAIKLSNGKLSHQISTLGE